MTADGFTEFWKPWPNKQGKKDARKAWPQAVQVATVERIVEGVHNYITGKPDWKAWMLPATFLRGERWEDEYEEPNPCADMGFDERREYSQKQVAAGTYPRMVK